MGDGIYMLLRTYIVRSSENIYNSVRLVSEVVSVRLSRFQFSTLAVRVRVRVRVGVSVSVPRLPFDLLAY